ncbi:MAG: hypothetical protein LBG17_03690 [Bacteroidales bacterium]|jgi:hypothetical protein|nr:hypothetical protein [Bacteroidales bacterium]
MNVNKIIFSIIFLLFLSTASAQFYIGAEAGAGGNYTGKNGGIGALGALNFGYLFWDKSDTAHTMGFMLEVGAEYNNSDIILI